MELRIAEHNHRPFIDGLRGIAILGVLLAHTVLTVGGKFKLVSLGYLAVSGGTGVQLFFLISAFTLYSSSKVRFQSEQRPISSFYIRRAFRILPYWWLMLAVFVVVSHYIDLPWNLVHKPGGGITPANLGAHAVFLFGFKPEWLNSVIPGEWTLFCEETFYLFLPLVFVHVKSLATAIQLIMLTLALHVLWFVARGGAEDALFTDFFPLSQWFNFAVGIALFFLLEHLPAEDWPARTARLADLALLVLLPYLLDVEIAHGPLPVTVAWTLLFIAAATPASFFHKLCTFRPLRQIGVCCYSIYLFHRLLLAFAQPLEARLTTALGLEAAPKEVRLLIWFPIMTVACYGLGVLSFMLIEKPCIDAGKRFLRWRAGTL